MKDFLKQLTTEASAKQLLGMYLEFKSQQGILSGYIVETEAYLGIKDEAAHSYQGKNTPRLTSMYQQEGTIYLYSMHTHLMLNIVTQEAGIPEGILIRGLQPVLGFSTMEKNRKTTGVQLSNGPGKLTQALGLKKALDGENIFASALQLSSNRRKIPRKIEKSSRIGIPNKGVWTKRPLRYFVSQNPYVSQQKKSQMNWSTLGWEREE